MYLTCVDRAIHNQTNALNKYTQGNINIIRCRWTYAAGDSAVQLDLLDERRVAGQGVTSGHGVLVGLLVNVLIKR